MGSCITAVRWVFFLFNLIFWIGGLGIIGVCLWLRFDPVVEKYVHMTEIAENKAAATLNEYYIAIYILLIVGAVMTIIGFLGCCGALKKSPCLLVSFFILLVLIVCLQIAAGALIFTFRLEMWKYVEESMSDIITQRYTEDEPRVIAIVDSIQTRNQCCGVKDYSVWAYSRYAIEEKPDGMKVPNNPPQQAEDEFVLNEMRGRVPRSCCNADGLETFPEDCGTGFGYDQLWQYQHYLHYNGCSEALKNALESRLTIIIGAAVGLLTLEILSMTLALMICCYSRTDNDFQPIKY